MLSCSFFYFEERNCSSKFLFFQKVVFIGMNILNPSVNMFFIWFSDQKRKSSFVSVIGNNFFLMSFLLVFNITVNQSKTTSTSLVIITSVVTIATCLYENFFSVKPLSTKLNVNLFKKQRKLRSC